MQKEQVTDNDMPMCECPICGKKWQADDWYELQEEDAIDCPYCGKSLEVTNREVSVVLIFEPASNATCKFCGKTRAASNSKPRKESPS